jgi:hypothetical protein
MDAFRTDRDDLSNSDQAPVLVAASSSAALERAIRTVEATGLRVAAKLEIGAARNSGLGSPGAVGLTSSSIPFSPA